MGLKDFIQEQLERGKRVVLEEEVAGVVRRVIIEPSPQERPLRRPWASGRQSEPGGQTAHDAYASSSSREVSDPSTRRPEHGATRFRNGEVETWHSWTASWIKGYYDEGGNLHFGSDGNPLAGMRY